MSRLLGCFVFASFFEIVELFLLFFSVFFFFKQKTAYEMRISDWSSDVCSSDLLGQPATAYGHFVRQHDGVTSEISRSRGAFWAGEAASQLDRPEDARRWYQTAAAYPATLYGQLAGQRMASEWTPPAVALLVIPAAKRAAFEAKDIVQAVRLLDALEQPRLQDLFVARLRQDAKDLDDYPQIGRAHD